VCERGWWQQVARTVADRARLSRGTGGVRRPAGGFAPLDVGATGGEPHYPVPWARTPATSFLWSAAATRAAIEPAGFRTLAWQDDTESPRPGSPSCARQGHRLRQISAW